MNWIVLVKAKANGRILDAFAMDSNGMEFYFQNDDAKWVNPKFTVGYKKQAFKILFADDSQLLTNPKPVMHFVGGRIKLEVRELQL